MLDSVFTLTQTEARTDKSSFLSNLGLEECDEDSLLQEGEDEIDRDCENDEEYDSEDSDSRVTQTSPTNRCWVSVLIFLLYFSNWLWVWETDIEITYGNKLNAQY